MIVYTPASFPCRAEMSWCVDRERRIRARMLSFGTLARESCQGDQCWYFIRPDPPAPKKEAAAAPPTEPGVPATKAR